jgi:hypothetical protein
VTTTKRPRTTSSTRTAWNVSALQRHPRWEAYLTADEAREVYQRVVAGDPVTPLRNSGVWKVRLVIDGEPQEELLVVRALPRLI